MAAKSFSQLESWLRGIQRSRIILDKKMRSLTTQRAATKSYTVI